MPAALTCRRLERNPDKLNLRITTPTSRGMERNPDKMEFEIVAPVKAGYFKESRGSV